jgi:hypothetical protein
VDQTVAMNIGQLAVAVYVYQCFTRYDESYRAFRKATGATCDLANPANRNELLIWLNKWGCRIDLKNHRRRASDELRDWYKQVCQKLPSRRAKLWELSDEELSSCANIFNALASKRTSGKRRRNYLKGRPTAAAKILFALRPNVFPLWDRKISAEKDVLDSGGYLSFLKRTKAEVLQLADECKRRGMSIDDLPKKLGGQWSSVLKLIDEYNWVTITKGAVLPDPDRLTQWLSWS